MSTDDLAPIFRAAGCRGWLCALDVDAAGEVASGADEPVVAASVFKVAVALECFRQTVNGPLDERERIRLRPGERSPGATGFSTFADDVEVSLRDLVRMMLVVSDNAATDAVLDRVGLANVNALTAALGLVDTVIVTGLRILVDDIGRDAGFADWADLQAASRNAAPAELKEIRYRITGASALRPERTTRTTAREAATLLRLIWRDEAAPADACAPVRAMMAEQVTRHRLAVGFGSDVAVAAKSGSLLGVIRNEVGVVEDPDGGRYAVAVFTRADEPFVGEHEINRAIGSAAALAVQRLRDARGT